MDANTTIAQLEAELDGLGVRAFKTLRAAGMWLAICPAGCGSGSDLATAIATMVAIVKERRSRVVFDDGHQPDHATTG